MMLNIADDKVIPRNDAVPLISVPRSDQFNCTESDMCFEQDCCIKSASLLCTWKSIAIEIRVVNSIWLTK